MKKIIKLQIVLFVLLLFFSNQKINVKEYQNGYIKIKYKLQNYPIIASNQMAIWIKNAKGNYITTIFVTKFMAKGGYKRREDCCPVWILESNWEKASNNEIDSVSRATQKAGIQEVLWNCKDKDGKQVNPGIYFYNIEANIYYDERVLFTGKIEIGNNKNSSKPQLKYFHTKNSKNKKKIDNIIKKYGNLIEEIEVIYFPE